MSITPETFEEQLPFYLTAEKKQGLVKALEKFFNERKVSYYTNLYPDEVLQGDGWHKLKLIDFQTVRKRNVRGIVLSNSCDVSQDNARYLPQNIVFAPLIRLNAYAKLLEQSGASEESVNSQLIAIRNQEVTNIFYLPAGGDLETDSIAKLDDLHTMPSADLESSGEHKIFTLSMVGFYLFLFKISTHFCRFHENVDR